MIAEPAHQLAGARKERRGGDGPQSLQRFVLFQSDPGGILVHDRVEDRRVRRQRSDLPLHLFEGELVEPPEADTIREEGQLSLCLPPPELLQPRCADGDGDGLRVR